MSLFHRVWLYMYCSIPLYSSMSFSFFFLQLKKSFAQNWKKKFKLINRILLYPVYRSESHTKTLVRLAALSRVKDVYLPIKAGMHGDIPPHLLPVTRLPAVQTQRTQHLNRGGRGGRFGLKVRAADWHAGDSGSNLRQGQPRYIWMYTPSAVSILVMDITPLSPPPTPPYPE
jgi:hypothetical protein